MTTIEIAPRLETHELPPAVITERLGKVLSVWGSAGSGKSLVATNLAFELASQNQAVLLVDLDSRRPSLAALLGLTDAGPGITAITRLGRQERLDASEIERLTAQIKFGSHGLDVLVGMNSPTRWPELDFLGLSKFLDLATRIYDTVVFDLNDELEQGLVSSKSAQERNFASRWAIDNSDLTLGCFSADAIGINRFLFDVRNLNSEVWAVANFVPQSSFGKNPEREIRQVLHQVGKIVPRGLLPIDHASVSWQLQTTKPLLMQNKSSKLANAFHMLALEIIDGFGQTINSTA